MTKNVFINTQNKLVYNIYSYIYSIDHNFNLPEQYNPRNSEKLSAQKLTWNYSEFYFLNLLLKL